MHRTMLLVAVAGILVALAGGFWGYWDMDMPSMGMGYMAGIACGMVVPMVSLRLWRRRSHHEAAPSTEYRSVTATEHHQFVLKDWHSKRDDKRGSIGA